MDIERFILSYYSNATEGVHIQKVKNSANAQKPHIHEYFQVFYVIEGHLTHYVGETSSTLYRGDMTIIPPNKQHHIGPTDSTTTFYSFSFMPSIFEDRNQSDTIAIKFLQQLNTISESAIHPKITLPNEDLLFIDTIMERIYKEFSNNNIGSAEMIKANTVILLTIFARTYFESIKGSIPESFDNLNQYVLHCVKYIDANLHEDLSLSEMAKRSAMSRSSFCNAFLEITGKPFKKYLNIKRIEHAVSLIKKGYQLTYVYTLCGYNDYSTFIRNFKKVMGVIPSQYTHQE